MSNLHKKLQLTAFAIATENFCEFEKKTLKVIEGQRGSRLSALSPTEILIEMLIKVSSSIYSKQMNIYRI